MTPADLAAWREHMAYTQRQAAAALGVTLATYQRLERGAEWADGAAVTAGLTPWGEEKRPD
jgi:DNA-binding XRE family transcriptional regulator